MPDTGVTRRGVVGTAALLAAVLPACGGLAMFRDDAGGMVNGYRRQ